MRIKDKASKIINQLKNNKHGVFVVVILFFLATGLFLNYLAEVVTNRNSIEVVSPSITNPQVLETQFDDIKISTNLPKVGNEIEVYSSGSSETALELAKGMAQKFNLTPHPELENIWVDTNNQYFLSFSPISDQITLSDLQAHSGNQSLDKDVAIKSAKNFIDLLDLNFQVEINQASLNSNSYEVRQGKQTIVVSFVQKINGLNLFHSNKTTDTIHVFVTQNYQISKVIINNPSLVANYSGKAQTLSSGKVLSEIKNGIGSVLSITTSTGNTDIFSEVRNINLNSAELEYRDDVKNKNIIPFYRLKGSAETIDGEPLTIEIIYPAIKTS
ncbi:MAG: hypothetical protein H6772_03630 [Pseudomonadales bacterium]|nr:hypothetical protein [Pseudomonadales bacterium]